MKWMRIAEIVDAFRIVPRLMLVAYGVACWQVGRWFMALSDPSMTQVAFVDALAFVAAGVFGLYVKSGRKWEQ